MPKLFLVFLDYLINSQRIHVTELLVHNNLLISKKGVILSGGTEEHKIINQRIFFYFYA